MRVAAENVGAMPVISEEPATPLEAVVKPALAAVTVTVEVCPAPRPLTVTADPLRVTVAPFVAVSV